MSKQNLGYNEAYILTSPSCIGVRFILRSIIKDDYGDFGALNHTDLTLFYKLLLWALPTEIIGANEKTLENVLVIMKFEQDFDNDEYLVNNRHSDPFMQQRYDRRFGLSLMLNQIGFFQAPAIKYLPNNNSAATLPQSFWIEHKYLIIALGTVLLGLLCMCVGIALIKLGVGIPLTLVGAELVFGGVGSLIGLIATAILIYVCTKNAAVNDPGYTLLSSPSKTVPLSLPTMETEISLSPDLLDSKDPVTTDSSSGEIYSQDYDSSATSLSKGGAPA